MKKAKMMKKYADLIAVVGIHANPKQDVIIKAPVEAYEFARYLALRLYANKARSVKVDYYDSALKKQYLIHEVPSRLDEIAEWEVQREIERTDRNCALINLIGDDPALFNNVNPNRIKRRNKAEVSAFNPLKKPYHNNELAWCIAAVPTKGWAKRIFPELSPTQGVLKLWKLINEACYITEDSDPIENWKEHIETLEKRAEVLNNYQFKTLHYISKESGTDINIGLVDNHIWSAAKSIQSRNGLEFVPNIPTQEVFTCPDRNRIDGVVYSSRPLSYHGTIIDKFYLEFKDGVVVSFKAQKGMDALEEIVNFDDGSCSLGEVALIPYDSPISKQHVIYQETLFDENASCHLALGQSFVENIVNGETMDDNELLIRGCNQSMMHVDFMIGTKDMFIEGIKEDGERVTIFKDGNFTF